MLGCSSCTVPQLVPTTSSEPPAQENSRKRMISPLGKLGMIRARRPTVAEQLVRQLEGRPLVCTKQRRLPVPWTVCWDGVHRLGEPLLMESDQTWDSRRNSSLHATRGLATRSGISGETTLQRCRFVSKVEHSWGGARAIFHKQDLVQGLHSRRFCQCGQPLDPCGHHRAACARVGVLGGAHSLESVAAICREAGARVTTNILVRDKDLAEPNAADSRRLEVVVTTVRRGAQTCRGGRSGPSSSETSQRAEIPGTRETLWSGQVGCARRGGVWPLVEGDSIFPELVGPRESTF